MQGPGGASAAAAMDGNGQDRPGAAVGARWVPGGRLALLLLPIAQQRLSPSPLHKGLTTGRGEAVQMPRNMASDHSDREGFQM